MTDPIIRKYSQPQEIKAFTDSADKGLESYERAAFSRLINKDDIVLDLGCGAGREAKTVAGMCAKIYGIDMVKAMLYTAKTRIENSNAYWICGAAEQLPIHSETMNIILMTKQFLNHLTTLKRRRNVMREVYRALKPGGRVFLTVHNNLFNIGIRHVINGVYKLFYNKFFFKKIAGTENREKDTNESRALSGIIIGAVLSKFRSVIVNTGRRIAMKLYKGYRGREPGDWEISQVSDILSAYKSPYHNFTIKELITLFRNCNFEVLEIHDTWELAHGKRLSPFIRKGAYTIAMILQKTC